MHSIAIGCDPNAQAYKDKIVLYLKIKGYAVEDMGSDDPIYANTAIDVAKAVAQKRYDLGVLICGTGIGMTISANKVPGAYAALISDSYSAERAKKSNNANIACFGAFTLGYNLMENLLDIFLNSDYKTGTSSEPKVNRIKEFEKDLLNC